MFSEKSEKSAASAAWPPAGGKLRKIGGFPLDLAGWLLP
jgi:hypothetical protein